MSTTTEDTSPPGLISDTSVRRKHPCVLCQQRKVKCDRDDPCANCRKARVECVSSSMQPPKRRKKRFPEAELLARIRKYEAHLRSYGADIDAINREEVPLPPPGLKQETSSSPAVFKTSMEQLEDGYRSLSVRESLKHVENNLSTGPLDEFQEADLSEEDETFDGALTKTYDAIPMDSSELFLFHSSSTEDLAALHPQPVQIFRLWQIYLDNINPVFKLFHTPTVQQRILDVSADPQTASKSMHVLMFGIYTMAVTSLTDEDCMSYFNEKRDELIKKYQNAAKLALVQARFMRSSDMTTLQGFMLHLFSCLNFNVDPRALFCLTGIAVRIAQRMGLNFDGTAYGLPPFETEMRRRLWWQIIFLDSRVGELAGCPPSMLQHLRTTRIPLNVNDSDLFPGMREPPVEHTGITEMIHVLPRCEIIKLYLEAKLTNVPARVRIPDSQIDEFEAFIEEKYLKWCDDSVPWHVLAKLATKTALAKVRLGNYKDYLMAGEKLTVGMDNSLKEKMVGCCLIMQETFFLMAQSKSLERFHWHIFKNFPFPAMVFILSAIRTGINAELEDRAWKQIMVSSTAVRERMKLEKESVSNPHQPAPFKDELRMAIANLTCKAWDATIIRRPELQTPDFIQHLRMQTTEGRTEEKTKRRDVNSSPATSPPETEIPKPTTDGVGYSAFGDDYRWMSQPSMFNNNEYNMEMGSEGQNMSGMMMDEAMAQDTTWNMWDEFAQAGGSGFDSQMGGQKSW